MQYRMLLGMLMILVLANLAGAQEPWSTYRGSATRSGNTDGKAGPASGKVLWSYKSAENFVASPLPTGGRVYLGGLGGFNIPTLLALSTNPAASEKERLVWKKSTPYLKLPTVSTPALLGGKLIFGDGMHQTSGAFLHALQTERGIPQWKYSVPGDLVHLEGSPTVMGGRILLGGGAAGVLCIDPTRLTLEGKELAPEEIEKIVATRWAELQARYQADKKKDPDFAVPPSEDQLPRPSPLKVWQVGQGKWHVDAPVAVVGNQVLLTSAFLEKEQVGERALISLDLATGRELWKTPLKINPWGGPSVSGSTIVVTGSTISYDLKALKNARGDLAAFDLLTGKEKWRKEIPGGVLGCAALTADAAVITATDGKVRVFDLASGERRSQYDARAPIFAPPAVVAGVAYVGDLLGVIHAIDLKSGSARWKIDLGKDPATRAPGSVYGGPVVHGGRVYVATCNLEGAFSRQPTVVVAIGEP